MTYQFNLKCELSKTTSVELKEIFKQIMLIELF